MAFTFMRPVSTKDKLPHDRQSHRDTSRRSKRRNHRISLYRDSSSLYFSGYGLQRTSVRLCRYSRIRLIFLYRCMLFTRLIFGILLALSLSAQTSVDLSVQARNLPVNGSLAPQTPIISNPLVMLDQRTQSLIIYGAVIASASVTGSGDGIVYIYLDATTGQLAVGSTVKMQCVNCTYQAGVTAFPSGSAQIAQWGIAAGKFSGTTPSYSVARVQPPTKSTDACTPGQWASDGDFWYSCVGVALWKRGALTSF
jgi:hypothetical protein